MSNTSEITQEKVQKALNQLTAVIIGGKFAKATNEYQNTPKKRIEECYRLTVSEQAEAFGDSTKISQIQRKIDSLQSLNVLASLAEEVEWD